MHVVGKPKEKNNRKLRILQKRNLYSNQFSNKNGAICKPEKRYLSGPHIFICTFPLNTPRGQDSIYGNTCSSTEKRLTNMTR